MSRGGVPDKTRSKPTNSASIIVTDSWLTIRSCEAKSNIPLTKSNFNDWPIFAGKQADRTRSYNFLNSNQLTSIIKSVQIFHFLFLAPHLREQIHEHELTNGEEAYSKYTKQQFL